MICKATTDDVRVLAEFASALWPERSADEIEEIFARQLTGDSDSAFFICYHEGGPIGFALCQLRHDYVEGTTTSPVEATAKLAPVMAASAFRKILRRFLRATCVR